MLKLNFANGVSMPYISAVETEEYWGGSTRRTITFTMDGSTDLSQLNQLCTEENCESLEMVNEEEAVTNIYDGYVLKLKLGMESNAIEGRIEEVVKLKLGKRTYVEQMLHQLGLQ